MSQPSGDQPPIPETVHLLVQLDSLNRKMTYLNAVVTVLALVVTCAAVMLGVFLSHTVGAGLE